MTQLMTERQEPTLNGTSTTSISEVCKAAMLVLLMKGVEMYPDRLPFYGML